MRNTASKVCVRWYHFILHHLDLICQWWLLKIELQRFLEAVTGCAKICKEDVCLKLFFECVGAFYVFDLWWQKVCVCVCVCVCVSLFEIFSYLQAWYDSSSNNCQKTQSSLQLSCHPYSIHTLTHLSPSLSSSLPHELPLPYRHPSLTSHMPPTPPPCQLTPEHGHIVLPFDPLPACRSTRGPRLQY